uniref:Uncharacterized protein n=1 Tax=Naja naja TaxID=35670 RepID=A0A8C6V5D5_NAJNA
IILASDKCQNKNRVAILSSMNHPVANISLARSSLNKCPYKTFYRDFSYMQQFVVPIPKLLQFVYTGFFLSK